MSLQDIRARHLKLISIHATRNAIRGGAGLVFLVLAAFFGLIVAHSLITPIEMTIKRIEKDYVERSDERLSEEDRQKLMQSIIDDARPVISWMVSPPESEDEEVQARNEKAAEEWTTYLVDEKPALLSAIFFILLFGMPFLIPFGAFNQTASEIGNRGLRYLLLRTERANIFLGRYLATLLYSVLVMAFVIATIALYVGFKAKFYPAAEIASWSSMGFLALAAVTIPYVALCSWISASNGSSMASLVLSKLIIGGVLLMAFLVRNQWEGGVYLKWLLPWGIQNELLAPDITRVGIAVLACLGYAAVFLFLGFRKFCNRDL